MTCMTIPLRLNVPYLSHLFPNSELMTFVLSNSAAFYKIYKGKSQSFTKIPFLLLMSGEQYLSPILSPRMDFQCIQGQKPRASDVAKSFSFCPIFTSAKTCVYRCRMTQHAYRDILCVTKNFFVFVYYLGIKTKSLIRYVQFFSGEHVIFTEIRVVASVKNLTIYLKRVF